MQNPDTTTPPDKPSDALVSPELQKPRKKKKRSTKQKAIRGTIWSVGSDAVREGIRLGGNLVLTYLLPREFFGYMTPVNTFQMGVEQVSSVGIRGSLIRSERGEEPDYIHTAWTIQAIRGLILFIVSVALAKPMAYFYPEVPDLEFYLPVVALALIFAGLSSTSLHLFVRKLDLKKVAIITIASACIRLSIMAFLAWKFKSIWALVLGSVIFQCSQMALSHILNPGPRNKFFWDKEAAKDIFDYGKWVFLGGIVTFGVKNIDRLLILKVVPDTKAGAAIAGTFAVAVPFSKLPHKIMSGLAQRVLFPVYAKFTRGNPEELEGRVLKARGIVLLATFSGCLAIALGGPAFFALLYKAEYADAGWMVQWLVSITWFSLLATSVDRVLLSLGDSKSVSISLFGRLAVALPCCLIGNSLYKLPGFIGGLTLGALVGHIILQFLLHRRKIRIIPQDIKFTLVLGALWVLNIVLVRLSGNEDPTRDITWGSILIPGAILACVGIYVLKKVKEALKDSQKKEPSAAENPAEEESKKDSERDD